MRLTSILLLVLTSTLSAARQDRPTDTFHFENKTPAYPWREVHASASTSGTIRCPRLASDLEDMSRSSASFVRTVTRSRRPLRRSREAFSIHANFLFLSVRWPPKTPKTGNSHILQLSAPPSSLSFTNGFSAAAAFF